MYYRFVPSRSPSRSRHTQIAALGDSGKEGGFSQASTAPQKEPFIVEFVKRAVEFSSSIALPSAISTAVADTARGLISFRALRGTQELPSRRALTVKRISWHLRVCLVF